jgi:hypothetical protein
MHGIVACMRMRSEQELLDSALKFRELANTGSDVSLQQALLLVAEEFEREAAQLGDTDSPDEPPPPAPHI